MKKNYTVSDGTIILAVEWNSETGGCDVTNTTTCPVKPGMVAKTASDSLAEIFTAARKAVEVIEAGERGCEEKKVEPKA